MRLSWNEIRARAARFADDWVTATYEKGEAQSFYNAFPFPWPILTAAHEKRLASLAQAVLDARAAHPGATLADLYDPGVMPADLRKAHQALDAAVDKLYRAAPFGSDRERVEHLFGLYEKVVAPLTAVASKPKRTSRAKAPA